MIEALGLINSLIQIVNWAIEGKRESDLRKHLGAEVETVNVAGMRVPLAEWNKMTADEKDRLRQIADLNAFVRRNKK